MEKLHITDSCNLSLMKGVMHTARDMLQGFYTWQTYSAICMMNYEPFGPSSIAWAAEMGPKVAVISVI